MATAIREAILDGSLLPGSRLPSEEEMAHANPHLYLASQAAAVLDGIRHYLVTMKRSEVSRHSACLGAPR